MTSLDLDRTGMDARNPASAMGPRAPADFSGGLSRSPESSPGLTDGRRAAVDVERRTELLTDLSRGCLDTEDDEL